jgi:hypothetical protein
MAAATTGLTEAAKELATAVQARQFPLAAA